MGPEWVPSLRRGAGFSWKPPHLVSRKESVFELWCVLVPGPGPWFLVPTKVTEVFREGLLSPA